MWLSLISYVFDDIHNIIYMAINIPQITKKKSINFNLKKNKSDVLDNVEFLFDTYQNYYYKCV